MTAMTSSVSLAILCCALGACSSVEPRADYAGDTRYSGSSSTTATTSYTPTVVDLVGICRELQRSGRIPFSCAVRYLGGQPAMVVQFASSREMETYLDTFAEYLGGPFCDAANRGNRDGYIVLALQSPAVGTVYSCERKQISKWFPLDRLSDS